MEPKIYNIYIREALFEPILYNLKTFLVFEEICCSKICIGDYLKLQKTSNDCIPTNQYIMRQVVYILAGEDAEWEGLQKGFGILGLRPIS